MAVAVVGGALLSGFINIVINKSLREDVVNRLLGKKLGPRLVERLKISLLAAEAVVDNAEYKQLGDYRVRDWLNGLRDAVYDADDFLDAVLTKAATQKKVRSLLPSVFLNRHRKMVDNMEEVVARIEFLVKQKDDLGLQKSTKDNNLSSSSSSSSSSSKWRETTCLMMEGKIYGREDYQQDLIKIINDKSESQLSVIPIVGLGGVGKTTLAKWAYRDVKGFDDDKKVWVCISETFDVAEITKKTIEAITKKSCTLGSLNLLQNKLQEILSGKKFFIVLDDVWSKDAHKWKDFITPFQCAAKGSSILLTTRNQEVASVVQTCPSFILYELSDKSCWLLFAANACFPQSNGNPILEEIGRKIIKKCKGLPLAVETLGRLLRGKNDAKEWNAVLRSDIWEFSTEDSKIIPALLISYYQLPPYLKRCFVYCSLFPKDYYFDKDKLVLLWMAEDLLRLPKRGESLEEVGSQCFEELASRLFFKPADEDFPEAYVMHDLLHDLAIFLAGDFYCRIEELGEQQKKKVLTRHLSHLPHGSLDHPISKVFKFVVKSETLRTSLYINDLLSMESRASKLKYLRVLSFRELDALPGSIGKLIHLRYLNLSGTNVKTLPESLCNLYNLQTLILYKCSNLTMLPNDMHKLVNLRHLDLKGTSLKEMPRGISKLKHLHTLSSFVVGKHKDNGIEELGGLSNLEGSFEIKKLENVADVRQARSARMLEKNYIDKLSLEWSSDHEMVSNTKTERDILDNLKPHTGLKELRMEGYKGERFPDWVGHCSYNNMTSITLSSCKNCCMLPSLGQLPSLKSLRIEGFNQLKRIGDEFYKSDSDHHSSPTAPFPSLERLEFDKMPCWEEWHVPDPEAFPQLKILQIERCRMLKGDMLNAILWRRDCCLREDDEGRSDDEMVGGGDALSIRPSQSFNATTINHLCCLQELRIVGCPSIVSFPDNCLPKSLQKLKIWLCPKFEFPEQQQRNYDLVDLQIQYSCDSLSSLSLDVFPNLKNLEISCCRNLESVSISEAPHAALQRLTITYCDKLVSFAGEGLAAPNLTHLQVKYCSKLEALPRDMKSLLPSLHSLKISGCKNICRLPEGGLPPNLKELYVGGCEEQLWDLSWIANFHALTYLRIEGYYDCDNIKSYLGSLPHLPSLTTLEIWGFDNLETLECNELLRLTSLQQLHIEWCPKMENMEGEKLPPSLLLLEVYSCDLLGKHCKNKHQLIWPKISHIPTIEVDFEQIF
ncbi:putative disease resistance protein At3g14460 [Arachis stenosperma]|uniref:putative disease resistance protein At3g14460 n=1 Tax=Arachis stenosperma TaxID=217475 RepID=UPI0025AC0ED9|nr:putative disease resistance protein At3g14460 [Arachis stenosperma]